MAFQHFTGVELGEAQAGLDPLPGYELWDDGSDAAVAAGAPQLAQAWTNENVKETRTPGNYTVVGGIALPTGFIGRVSWRIRAADAATVADEWVNGITRLGGVSPAIEDCR